MPIEFRCTGCEKLLRVPDESAGSQARCPQCQAIIVVPQASAAAATTPAANPFAIADKPPAPGSNPYSAPTHSLTNSSLRATPSGKFMPTAVQAGDVMSYAWDTWKSNLGLLIGVGITVMGASIAMSVVQEIVSAIFIQQRAQELAIFSSLAISVIGNLIQLFLGIGQTKIVLKLLRQQQAEFGELFSGGKLFLPVLGASILAGIAMMLGFLLLIIPGILLALYFWSYYALIVDEKAGAIDSFGVAKSIGSLNVGTTFVLFLASMGIMILGLLAFCVGIIFAAPLVSTIWGAAYLTMSGQIVFRHQQMT